MIYTADYHVCIAVLILALDPRVAIHGKSSAVSIGPKPGKLPYSVNETNQNAIKIRCNQYEMNVNLRAVSRLLKDPLSSERSKIQKALSLSPL